MSSCSPTKHVHRIENNNNRKQYTIAYFMRYGKSALRQPSAEAQATQKLIGMTKKKSMQSNIVGEAQNYGMQLRLCVQIGAVRFSRREKKLQFVPVDIQSFLMNSNFCCGRSE